LTKVKVSAVPDLHLAPTAPYLPDPALFRGPSFQIGNPSEGLKPIGTKGEIT
jgi:hypothetical protein